MTHTQRLSISWSNRHQTLFNSALLDALDSGRLVITPDGGFELSPVFFDHASAKDFLDKIPEDDLKEMIQVWVDKRK
ncbi:hypothetical protein [Marinobacter qingdaonensis]|uniref:Uncharacterized protein n=1 Tax=Marinobacter qingdaonensis TaxID=3108486 RepID=A0ABU5NUK7_9GAMM|nr:hypothetical protein [Marinobacter sp. ASW11-75]MEA1079503.1 hypothetical protein [Marinobacter sp. ASW11-75]